MASQTYQSCINACQVCAVACDHCLNMNLSEQDMDTLRRCIQLDRDCSKICYTAVTFMASDSPFAGQVCELCAQICDACAEECEKHAHHMDHCRECAQACRRCAEECRRMMNRTA